MESDGAASCLQLPPRAAWAPRRLAQGAIPVFREGGCIAVPSSQARCWEVFVRHPLAYLFKRDRQFTLWTSLSYNQELVRRRPGHGDVLHLEKKIYDHFRLAKGFIGSMRVNEEGRF